ncbi:hypothetical protein D5086_005830 [Populus alba]|uniref:Uncharacterized protein n=1 Tax=Populus alba TaxID=43335 RepID=A0ACC4CUR1_POPAL
MLRGYAIKGEYSLPAETVTMLEKLLKAHKLSPFARSDLPKPANPTTPEKLEIASSALKIIHVGGRVECYYIAISWRISLSCIS